MNNEYTNLTVEKDSNKFTFLAMGIFQAGFGLFMIIVLLKTLISKDFTTEGLLLTILAIIISTPLGIYHLTYAFGDKKLFEINSVGITTNQQKTISWKNIYEIETKKYRGPRMEFYQIKIIQDYDRTKKISLWFSSDIKTDWTQIIDYLSYYTIKNNINLT